MHASDSPQSAEREIKLWFKPNDIMPFMRLYPTVRCERHYYVLGDRLCSSYRPGASAYWLPAISPGSPTCDCWSESKEGRA